MFVALLGRVIPFATAMATVSCVTTSTINQEPNDPREIPFEFLEGDTAIVVPATLGNRDVKLLFDTGAGIELISEKLGKDLGIDPSMEITGMRLTGEKMKVKAGQLSSLSFGDIKKENLVVGVHKYFDNYATKHGIYGLLSLKVFANQPVTVDYIRKKIIIETRASMRQREKFGTAIPVYFEKQDPRSLTVQVDFLVDGKWTQIAMVDTGSAPTKLPMKYFSKLGLSEDSPGLKKKPVKTIAGFDTVAHLVKANSKIAIKSAPKFTNPDYNIRFDETLRMGSIGGHFFLDKVVTFDLANKRMIISRGGVVR